ncbi:hypothetical protein TUM4630_23710 [Shewanella algidipiscicola]|uniref:Uncharacterized protein n=1 Tax=Shewanella algidipiscicola TaxID=614070 RepID=A0ABQ4PJY6_9GAMM|nr:hypothetical protein TUM4630_23710 [Shewanella algidipiscicola]
MTPATLALAIPGVNPDKEESTAVALAPCKNVRLLIFIVITHHNVDRWSVMIISPKAFMLLGLTQRYPRGIFPSRAKMGYITNV